jgi:hypothetical protein
MRHREGLGVLHVLSSRSGQLRAVPLLAASGATGAGRHARTCEARSRRCRLSGITEAEGDPIPTVAGVLSLATTRNRHAGEFHTAAKTSDEKRATTAERSQPLTRFFPKRTTAARCGLSSKEQDEARDAPRHRLGTRQRPTRWPIGRGRDRPRTAPKHRPRTHGDHTYGAKRPKGDKHAF